MRIALTAVNAENTVLRITTIDAEGRRKLVLEGKLIEPWVGEFKKAWQEANESRNGHSLVVDLGNVTVISPQGEGVLSEIMRDGAEFVCGGIHNKHVVRQIERRCRR